MMLGVWGVLQNTLLEARRSRLFLSFFLFAIAVLIAIPMFPAVGAQDKAKFITYWSLGSAYFLGAFTLLFFVAPSLSREIEEKTLQQILVKPIGRFAYFLGRVLGYGVISLAIFVGMGLLSWLSLWTQEGELADTPLMNPAKLIEANRLEKKGQELDSKDWEIARWLAQGGTLQYDFGDLRGREIGAQNVTLLVALPGSYTADYQSFCQGGLLVENKSTGKDWRSGVLLGREAQRLEVPAEFFQGKVQITVLAAGGHIGLEGRSWPESRGVRILVPKQGILLLNWLNAFILKGLSIFVLASCALAFSTLISGKLALVLSLCLFLAGSAPSYIYVAGRLIRGDVEMGHGHSHAEGEHGEEKNGPPNPVMSILASVADGFAAILPDLDRFDVREDLLAGYNVSWKRNLELLRYLFLYLGVSLVIGGSALKFREMA